MKEKNKKRNSYSILLITSIVMISFALLIGVLVYFQMKKYEKGMLDVCATQQDAYVQLVLDQINLKENRDDEEIITDILGTLDASSNKYWTFSSEEAMLFVKDVLETNKYKGFTTATYYASDSAMQFLNNLQVNRVTHASIIIGNDEYIASGVVFNYGNSQYRLCLLTAGSIFLDNNNYLEAKVELGTVVVVILLILVIISMYLSWRIQKLHVNLDVQEDTVSTLNIMLSKVNKRLSESDLHNTRINLWKQDAFWGFVEKLKDRHVKPVVITYIKSESTEVRSRFLEKAHYMLDKNVLRFEYGKNDLMLIFVQIDIDSALQSLIPLSSKQIYVNKSYVINNDSDFDLDKIKSELMEEK